MSWRDEVVRATGPRTPWLPPLARATTIAVLLAVGQFSGELLADDAARSEFSSAAGTFAETTVFTSGEDGYHTYRIPAIIATAKGTLLAFCEGRKSSRSDSGNIDLVLKRSSDGGQTWSQLEVIADDGPNTIGNPCPVVDRNTETIWLPLTWNLGKDTEDRIKAGTSEATREVYVMHSTDDGRTWSERRRITDSVKDPAWGWYATGPGCGIQLTSGRMVIPCDHSVLGSQVFRSHVIYSDDTGRTWHKSDPLDDGTNECQVVERTSGQLLLNMRSYHKKNRRAVATSDDRGETWSPITHDLALIEPVCQASLLRFDDPASGVKGLVLFANPASTKREKMTIRLSRDEGRTWPVAKTIYDGSAAYSSLVALPGDSIGCLYEKDNYTKIVLARFDLAWLNASNP